jgi:hypothetical protein
MRAVNGITASFIKSIAKKSTCPNCQSTMPDIAEPNYRELPSKLKLALILDLHYEGVPDKLVASKFGYAIQTIRNMRENAKKEIGAEMRKSTTEQIAADLLLDANTNYSKLMRKGEFYKAFMTKIILADKLQSFGFIDKKPDEVTVNFTDKQIENEYHLYERNKARISTN